MAYTPPSWIRAKPHAGAEKQVGDSDPSARIDVINRVEKGFYAAFQRILTTLGFTTQDFTDQATVTSYNAANTINFTVGTASLDVAPGAAVDVNANLTVTSAVQVGQAWTTPAFNAADFTAPGIGTFVVAAGDVNTYAYIIFGKTMTLAFQVVTATVTGNPAGLRIAIPEGKTGTKSIRTFAQITDNGTITTGVVYSTPAAAFIEIARLDGANFANSTDNTNIIGEITFEIN